MHAKNRVIDVKRTLSDKELVSGKVNYRAGVTFSEICAVIWNKYLTTASKSDKHCQKVSAPSRHHERRDVSGGTNAMPTRAR